MDSTVVVSSHLHPKCWPGTDVAVACVGETNKELRPVPDHPNPEELTSAILAVRKNLEDEK